jgi:hypothetical protein
MSKSNRWPDLSRSELEFISQYLSAKKLVIDSGYADEIDWQDDIRLDPPSESTFLREVAWVILCAGIAEKVIRAVFPRISTAFCNWSSASRIAQQADGCRAQALQAFSNRRKIDAIIRSAQLVGGLGFESVVDGISKQGTEFLIQFPYIGPVTAFHLAKNIGLDVAKPDRHLVRIAQVAGYKTPQEMCSLVSALVGDSVPVVDIVLWRYATLQRGNYLLFDRPTPIKDRALCE